MANTTVTPVQATTATETVLTTKEVAARFKIKPIQLRRILRNMPVYADGVHTNYRWKPTDTQAMKAIEAAIATRAEAKAKAAAKAKAELAAKAATPTK